MTSEPGIPRDFVSKRLLNPAKDPPEFQDEVLPTVSLKLKGPLKRGFIRAPRGTILGSYRVTGSFYENAPGTFSLRITRLSVFSGSRESMWMLRHSRQGTVDVIHFVNPGQETRLGGPMEPVYALGPGTVSWGFIGDAGGGIGSAYTMGQFMEGLAN